MFFPWWPATGCESPVYPLADFASPDQPVGYPVYPVYPLVSADAFTGDWPVHAWLHRSVGLWKGLGNFTGGTGQFHRSTDLCTGQFHRSTSLCTGQLICAQINFTGGTGQFHRSSDLCTCHIDMYHLWNWPVHKPVDLLNWNWPVTGHQPAHTSADTRIRKTACQQPNRSVGYPA